jgi:hypothetical protein
MNCYADNPPDAKQCSQCKAELVRPTCPAGLHEMDPTWAECAYCKAEGVGEGARSAGRGKTMVESGPSTGAASRSTVSENDPYAGQGSYDPGRSAGTRSKTQFYSSPGQSSSTQGGTTGEPAAAPGRKIVGIIVTYTWSPDGRIFPIREGRNLIGRDPSKCDIAVPEDDTLSAVNTHITFRKSFVIGDNVSMSGTDVNGEPVEEQFKPLSNYSTIRTGSTTWTFITVNPDDPAAGKA